MNSKKKGDIGLGEAIACFTFGKDYDKYLV